MEVKISGKVLLINYLCFMQFVAGLVVVKSSHEFSNATTYILYTTFFTTQKVNNILRVAVQLCISNIVCFPFLAVNSEEFLI